MKTRTSTAVLLALFAAVYLAQGLSKPKDIIDYYRLLAREKKIADVLKQNEATWVYRASIDEGKIESRVKPIVDVKNGYIKMAYTVEACSPDIELALFIGNDKRNFVAVSDAEDCAECYHYNIDFYNCDNDRLAKISNAFNISYRDFLGEKGVGAINSTVRENAVLLKVRYQLPRRGTSVMATLPEVEECVGTEEYRNKLINGFIKKYRAWSKIELVWDMKKAAFMVKKKYR